MRQIRSYMDEAETAGIVKNDAELAKRLNVASATVSRWRNGERAPDDEQAIALAKLLGKTEAEMLATCAAVRAKSPKARAAWAKMAKMASMTTATVLLTGVSSIMTPSPASVSGGAECQLHALYYVKYDIV